MKIDVERNIERVMHESHLRFQREALRADKTSFPSAVIRGERRRAGASELRARERRAQYWTMANAAERPNFARAFAETLAYMAKHGVL